MAKFKKARPEIEEMARKIIAQHHSDLVEAKIEFIEKDGEWNSKGKIKLGSAQKVSDKMKALINAVFIITINGPVWNQLQKEEKEALLDHELCHCVKVGEDKFGNPKWDINSHDVEEFSAIIRRHGLWKPDLVQFGKNVRVQLRMFDDAGVLKAVK